MKHEILSAPKGATMTHKQGGLLFKLTGLKFWEAETPPPPTIQQASILINGLLEYLKDHKKEQELIDCIQIWFPSFDDPSEIHPRYFKHREKSEDKHEQKATEQKPKTHTTAETPQKPEPEEKQPEPEKPEPEKPEPVKSVLPQKPKPVKTADVKGQEQIQKLIEAGIRNIWMVGPAGCGKTTICQQIGEDMGVPVTVVPCGAGTSAANFLGYKYPEREGTSFTGAFGQPGIIVLDEFTALEAQVAQIVNGALANNELHTTVGTFKRHPDLTIIATSNTFGNGADRLYVSNNQLDASTRDRFACGIVEIDYSTEYESQYDPEVVSHVHKLRKVIDKNGLRKIASTRAIINGCLLKAAGLDWKNALITDWSKDEKALLQ